jgi:thiamine biosynthesis lipoprotein
MGMPITLEVVGGDDATLTKVYDYFRAVDERFSTYKKKSEISLLNAGLPPAEWSDEMTEVLKLCEQTRAETDGYFDIRRDGQLDPSGLVKGWAIYKAGQRLLEDGVQDFLIDAGGDIQPHGVSGEGKPWRVGIRNPFQHEEIVKTLAVTTQGVATSGTAVRGQHIYNPKASGPLEEIVSLTVVGPNIYEADRFATAAFAMGRAGIGFIESRPGLEGYMIDKNGLATMTTAFEGYVDV